MKNIGETSSILAVDDHQTNLNLVGTILEAKHYKVYYAQDANEAIKILNTNHIDLILLDILMPGINGFQLCDKIKETEPWKDIPIIFISALSDSKEIVKGLKQGGVDYILKPFDPEELLARIKIQLENKKMNEQYIMQLDDLRKTNRFLLGTMHEMAKVMEDNRLN